MVLFSCRWCADARKETNPEEDQRGPKRKQKEIRFCSEAENRLAKIKPKKNIKEPKQRGPKQGGCRWSGCSLLLTSCLYARDVVARSRGRLVGRRGKKRGRKGRSRIDDEKKKKEEAEKKKEKVGKRIRNKNRRKGKETEEKGRKLVDLRKIGRCD